MILIADIGGTNTRIALGDDAGRLHRLRILRNTDFNDLRTPLAEAVADGRDVSSGIIALAAPVDADHVALTNFPRKLSRPELQVSLGLRRLLFVNDFVAAAHAVPALTAGDLFPIQTGDAPAGANILVCGPGTGFGAAALVGERNIGIATEAGHMILGATNDEERDLFAHLALEGRPLSVETAISGAGLRAVYHAVSGKELSSEAVIASAQAGEKDAGSAVAAFMRVFGRVSGDLALAYNALGGVYIAGGLGRALQPLYHHSPFLTTFNDHPPFRERMRRVPINLVSHEQPVLVGALRLATACSPQVSI